MTNKDLQKIIDAQSSLFALAEGMRASQEQIAKSFGLLNSTWQKDLAARIKQMTTPFSRQWLDRFQNSIALPKTMETMKKIADQQTRIFDQWKAVGGQIEKVYSPAYMQSLQNALGRLSVQIAESSLIENDLETLKEFEEVANEVAEINERISEKEYATKEDVDEMKALVMALIPKAKKKKVWRLLIWINLFLGIIWQYVDPYITISNELRSDAQQPATKQDLENLKNALIDTLRQESQYTRIVNRVCKVRSRPKTRSQIIETLSPTELVIVITKKGKWAFVSFSSHEDGLPTTGWVMKKYLSKKSLLNLTN